MSAVTTTASGKVRTSSRLADAIGRPRFNFTSLKGVGIVLAAPIVEVRFGAYYGFRSDIALSPKSAITEVLTVSKARGVRKASARAGRVH